MFRPAVAIIRSLSFDTLQIILYNCVVACVMRRSQHQGPLFEYSTVYIYIYTHTYIYIYMYIECVGKLLHNT